MTSHFLDRVQKHDQDRQLQHQGNDCLFCEIVARREPAYIVAETDEYMAFLDTLPIRTGHTLLIPKKHVARLSELSYVQGAALAKGLTDVARAMEKGLQVASNQEYAQTVDHVHFHIVPAPSEDAQSSVLQKWTPTSQFSFMGRRDELADDEGKELSSMMQRYLSSAKL